MTDAKFTKGPWSLLGENLDRDIEVICDATKETVCIVLAEPDGEYSGAAPADARLIAAAPEMHDAILDASFYLKSLGARLAALDLDTTETYGVLKTASMFAQHLDAVLAKAASSQTEGSPQDGG